MFGMWRAWDGCHVAGFCHDLVLVYSLLVIRVNNGLFALIRAANSWYD
jgi:hypothetical protein